VARIRNGSPGAAVFFSKARTGQRRLFILTRDSPDAIHRPTRRCPYPTYDRPPQRCHPCRRQGHPDEIRSAQGSASPCRQTVACRTSWPPPTASPRKAICVVYGHGGEALPQAIAVQISPGRNRNRNWAPATPCSRPCPISIPSVVSHPLRRRAADPAGNAPGNDPDRPGRRHRPAHRAPGQSQPAMAASCATRAARWSASSSTRTPAAEELAITR
jgi:hypothetical protein